MKDLFKQAGITATATAKGKKGKRAPMENERTSEESSNSNSETESSFGGHNLRQLILTKQRDCSGKIEHRPRSALASKGRTLPGHIVELAPPQDDDDEDDIDDEDDEDAADEDAGDGGDHAGDGEEDSMNASKKLPNTTGTPAPAGVAPAPAQPPKATVPATPFAQPFDPTHVQDDSALGTLAAALHRKKGFNLDRELGWQTAVGADATKQKTFRHDVTQQIDVIALGFMHPSSPYIQLLHSVATNSVRGGGGIL